MGVSYPSFRVAYRVCAEQRWENTLLGSTFFVRAAVTCVMTSLKLFSFRSVENRLFSFSSMLDNDYLATEIIWRILETD